MELSVFDPVTKVKYISDSYQDKLTRLGISTIADLLSHFPRTYQDTSNITPIAETTQAGNYTLQGRLIGFGNIYTRSRKNIQRASLTDATGKIAVMWFNQRYLQSTFNEDKDVILYGKVTIKDGKATLLSPKYEIVASGGISKHFGIITPIYRLTQGITEKWIRNRVREVLFNYSLDLNSPTDQYLPDLLNEAVQKVHFPENVADIEKSTARLSIEELVSIMLNVERERSHIVKQKAPVIKADTKLITDFVRKLPFELTADQLEVIQQIIADMARNSPMHRLVQGDVGSGKTIVSVIAALAALKAGFQVAYLAPTVVLAEQQFRNIKKYLADYTESIALVSGKSKKIETKSQIYIGTTALLARKENLFDNLGLIIVDEQHKFGVKQRHELQNFMHQYSVHPHVLDMTATPIPRTVALTLFGELEVSLINTKPKDRLPIRSHIVPQEKRADSCDWIRQKVMAGEQVYWVCPAIEENAETKTKSVKEVYEELSSKIYPQFRIGILHGKLKEAEKTDIMLQFQNHELDILVSTTVIEVGIDVANATVMVIEDADRLGLAQLHQIRGRVGRSEKQSWCFVFESENISVQGLERLAFFAANDSGNQIAEFDLAQRGPGEVYGTMQSGIPDLKIAKLNDMNMIVAARNIAIKLRDQGIEQLPLMQYSRGSI